VSTIKVDSIKSADGNTDLLTLSNGAVSGVNLGRRNLIINGAMQVAQRGTSFAGTSAYTLDRWQSKQAGGGAFTTSQSSDSPDDFTNSLLVTVTTADAIDAASDRYWMETRLEGNSVSQLNFGSSAAKQVTLSFYVKSSIAGTYAGALLNGDANRGYIFNYTISSANTWERKTITIAGDTTGTWYTNTSIGITLKFNLGSGSDYVASAETWAASNAFNTSGSTQLISTNSSTWQITGVQLEVGSVATPFEHRSYGEELALCQRYYTYLDTDWTNSVTGNYNGMNYTLPVTMRSTPSRTIYSRNNNASGNVYYQDGATNVSIGGQNFASGGMLRVDNISTNFGSNMMCYATFDAEL